MDKIQQSPLKDSFNFANAYYNELAVQKQGAVTEFTGALDAKDESRIEAATANLRLLDKRSDSVRAKVKTWISSKEVGGDSNDTNYIFLRFVMDYLPAGLVGLLIAIIFLASWGSIAAAVNSLASCTMIDFHRRFSKKEQSCEQEYKLSKWYTLAWGVFCIVVAMFTYNIGNSLIEAVNILGSLFYGVILGVFLVAFFFKNVRSGNAVFWGAILAEILVLVVFILTRLDKPLINMGFLWLNPIGAIGVILFTLLLNKLRVKKG